nr:zinc finger, CCHC-type [Tanacetum cinerariifolium]
MASMNTRLNIEKLDGNIVQKHGGSKQVGLKQLGSKLVGFKQLGVKQVGFKQLGPSVETGVHGVHDEKRVWFEVELQGVQGDREAEVFQRSTQQCMKSRVAKHLGVVVIQQQNGLVKETNVTLLAKVLHGFEFEVEPLGDHTSEVEPQENVDQGAGLQEVQTQDLIYYHLARDREQHLACELFGYREDINEATFAVVVVEKIYAHELPNFNNTVACEVIPKWKAGMKDDMDAWLDVYVLSNSYRK